MAAKERTTGKDKILRMRKSRFFGFTNAILSNTTVYLNPCTENNSSFSVEEMALFAAVTKNFSNKNS
ncbi:hypothetical protein SAMN04489760_10727 [Syntrophus gentianae]|uniref:Uncharacterized protein n=1 Tax=Syntrophus gentianae TaxID=43775 RepID=A0A1H7WLP9_9BACT|nr:hypothetical protein [Syntrophus gentianae]SEM22401.1 hypothetical protein SAMN04489760_10727 [Syntrophus gentianae]